MNHEHPCPTADFCTTSLRRQGFDIPVGTECCVCWQIENLFPPPHRWDGGRWTCLRCNQIHPDPCACPCHALAGAQLNVPGGWAR